MRDDGELCSAAQAGCRGNSGDAMEPVLSALGFLVPGMLICTGWRTEIGAAQCVGLQERTGTKLRNSALVCLCLNTLPSVCVPGGINPTSRREETLGMERTLREF